MPSNALERDVYIIPDQRFGLSASMSLKLLKPFYGLTESIDKYTSFLKKLGLRYTSIDL